MVASSKNFQRNPGLVTLSQVACTRCNGTGWVSCPDCKGRGIYRQGTALWTQRSVCPKCVGKGVLGKCELCSGTGRIEKPDEAQNRESTQLELPVQSYDFSEEQILSMVEKGRVGNYALGYSAFHGDTNTPLFHSTFIGRSDHDLQEELLARLTKKKPWYDRFKFSYAATVREAFENECRDFHLAPRTLDNEKHPQPPARTHFACPIPNCSALD